MTEHVPPQISATTSHTWLGIMKNETVNLGSSHISTADAEKYLVYDDGTPFVDFGGQGILMNENGICMYDQTFRWNDANKKRGKGINAEIKKGTNV